MKKNILILGAGNMVSALFSSLKNSPHQFSVFTPSGTRAKSLAKELKGEWIEKIEDLKKSSKSFDMIFLGFKPQMFKEATSEFLKNSGMAAKDATIVSMLAGTPLEVIQRTFQTQKVIRIMPNTPSLMGLGITLIQPAIEVDSEEQKVLEEILKPSGETFTCQSENQLDQITAITGSGPAYIFEFARLMTEYLNKKGLSESESSSLVSQLFLGSSKMLSESEDNFETLRNKVTSPNGVTFEALEAFKQARLGDIFDQAFERNFSRSLELREEALKIDP